MNRDVNVAKMPVRKYRRDTSEVSCCLKYVIFGFNVMFWVSIRTCYRTIQCHWSCCRTAGDLCCVYCLTYMPPKCKLNGAEVVQLNVNRLMADNFERFVYFMLLTHRVFVLYICNSNEW